MKVDKLEILSYGGGTQSSAMAVLIAQGVLEKPDCVIIADTGYEAQATWTYWDTYAKPLFDSLGIRAVRISREKDTGLGRNRISPIMLSGGKRGGKEKVTQIPAFVVGPDKRVGMLKNFCSNNWKADVIKSWIHHNLPPAKNVFQWIGFSKDEIKRALRSKVNLKAGKWRQRYPLIELGMHRHQSIKLVEEFGWPTPPRSACWMCPYKDNFEWRNLRDNSPGEFKKAIKMEKWLNDNQDDDYKEEYHIRLHRSGKTLDEADFEDSNEQQDLPFGCDSGHCFT